MYLLWQNKGLVFLDTVYLLNMHDMLWIMCLVIIICYMQHYVNGGVNVLMAQNRP